MALVNPGIALSVENFKVPNMLGMASEAESIQNKQVTRQAAQQEMERAQYAQAVQKSRDALSYISTPEQYLAWHEANHKDPVLGSMLSKMGVSADQSRGKIMAELQKPGGLERLIEQSAAGADKLSSIMSGRLNTMAAERKAQADRAAKAERQALIQGNIQSVMGGGGTNALATGTAPTVSSNALAAPPAPAGASIMTPEAVAAATPTAAPTTAPAPVARGGFKADDVRNQVVQLRRLAAADPVNREMYAAAADQLEKTLPDESKSGASADKQAYELWLSTGGEGSFQDFKEEFAGFDLREGADGVLYKINRITGVPSPVEFGGQLAGEVTVGGVAPSEPPTAAPAAGAQVTSETKLPSVDDLSTPLSDTRLFKVPPKGNKVTEDERKASAALSRVLSAVDQIAGVTAKTPSAAAPGGLETAALVVPLWDAASSELVNWARPPERQIVAAAQRDLIDALLFLATGAAYNKEQLQGQMESYLPKYTDKEQSVIDAKRQRLIELIQQSKVRAGAAWTPELDAKVQNLIENSFPKTGATGTQNRVRTEADEIIRRGR